MTGSDLHQLLLQKWGRSYDVQLRRVQNRLYLQVMWKYLEQVSFPLSPEQYHDRLERMANHLTALQVVEQVQTFIQETSERPRVGKAVSVPLSLTLGARSAEWLVD
ncbi:MAG: DUF3067 family protein [Prochlorotrichaceae cyanobacterium]